MKKGKLIISGVVIVILVVLGVVAAKRIQNKPGQAVAGESSSKMILFYGETCPHCKKVEEFIKNNQIDSKLQIDQKEVYSNKNNQALLGEKAKSCKMDTNSIGVPFLWTGSDCLVGDQPIIDYFNQQINK
jgi:glutaredoxin